MESWFGVKQMGLWLLKFVCCLITLRDNRKDFVYLFGYMIVCVLTLPLMYLIALPADDWGRKDSDIAALTVVDEDILKRTLKLLWNSEPRSEDTFHVGGYRFTVKLGKRLPLVSRLFGRFVPSWRAEPRTGPVI
eukprot:NODE_30992_length_406_cov_1.616487.p1 GENE.NODE_30992_length_406_cov_1.616487~~NODE_30992_length_406_cov_1.616487.p1  ORF type:complete len:134 (+),score=44.47 NODE_30992_length_406_cov_1.616487:3-404(+)